MVENVTDYFAIELDEGKLKYYLNFGDQTQIGIIPEVSFHRFKQCCGSKCIYIQVRIRIQGYVINFEMYNRYRYSLKTTF